MHSEELRAILIPPVDELRYYGVCTFVSARPTYPAFTFTPMLVTYDHTDSYGAGGFWPESFCRLGTEKIILRRLRVRLRRWGCYRLLPWSVFSTTCEPPIKQPLPLCPAVCWFS